MVYKFTSDYPVKKETRIMEIKQLEGTVGIDIDGHTIILTPDNLYKLVGALLWIQKDFKESM